jgi:hypothetical protein
MRQGQVDIAGRWRILPLVALCVGLIVVLVSAPAASAQQLPPICDEYPNLPQCQQLPDDDDGDNPDATGPSANGDAAGGGELPFTGYPLTGLILILFVLLIAGLALRTAVAIRDRLTQGRPPAS